MTKFWNSENRGIYHHRKTESFLMLSGDIKRDH